MLMYHVDEEFKAAAVYYINEGLKSDHGCVYASVGAYDNASKWHYSNLSSNIENFDENVKQGNLVIIELKPLFEAARKGDPEVFNKVKSQLEVMLKQRVADNKYNKLLVFADAACTLLKNEEFEGCLNLEGWWQSAHKEWTTGLQNISVICPHPATVLDELTTAAADAKAQISMFHSVVLHARRHYYQKQQQQSQQTEAAPVRPIRRVLIVEPEEDVQIFYRALLDPLALEVIIVPNVTRSFEYVFDTKDSKHFDLIILDTNLEDVSGIVAARQIKQRLPDQRIIITTTNSSADEIERIGVSRDDILYKPFSSTVLLGLMKPEKQKDC
jgi:CheY-like chemotaxis protein